MLHLDLGQDGVNADRNHAYVSAKAFVKQSLGEWSIDPSIPRRSIRNRVSTERARSESTRKGESVGAAEKCSRRRKPFTGQNGTMKRVNAPLIYPSAFFQKIVLQRKHFGSICGSGNSSPAKRTNEHEQRSRESPFSSRPTVYITHTLY